MTNRYRIFLFPHGKYSVLERQNVRAELSGALWSCLFLAIVGSTTLALLSHGVLYVLDALQLEFIVTLTMVVVWTAFLYTYGLQHFLYHPKYVPWEDCSNLLAGEGREAVLASWAKDLPRDDLNWVILPRSLSRLIEGWIIVDRELHRIEAERRYREVKEKAEAERLLLDAFSGMDLPDFPTEPH